MPALSLIIPVYNVAGFVEKCIDSILAQPFTDFEIILVDDGSTDDSLEICKKYQDSRITILEKENGGLSSARNFGMERASGDYIWFIDSDDWISENSLEIINDSLAIDPVDILLFSFYYVDLNGQVTHCRQLVAENHIYTGLEYVERFKVLEPSIWTKVFRRRFLLDFGLRFEEGMVYEDLYFNLHAFRLAQKIKGIERFLYNYRRRKNSITTSRPGHLHLESQLKMMAYLKNLSAGNVYHEDYLRKQLKYELYALFKLLWRRDAAVGQLQPYFTRIEELAITIPVDHQDSWIDRVVKKAFNSSPRKAYPIYLLSYITTKVGDKVFGFQRRIFRKFTQSTIW